MTSYEFKDIAIFTVVLLLVAILIYVAYKIFNDYLMIKHVRREYAMLLEKLHSRPEFSKVRRPESLSDLRRMDMTLKEIEKEDYSWYSVFRKKYMQEVRQLILTNKKYIWTYAAQQLIEDVHHIIPESPLCENLIDIEDRINRLKNYLEHDFSANVACWPIKTYCTVFNWLLKTFQTILEGALVRFHADQKQQEFVAGEMNRLFFILQKYLAEDCNSKVTMANLKQSVIKITSELEEDMENALYIYYDAYNKIVKEVPMLPTPKPENMPKEYSEFDQIDIEERTAEDAFLTPIESNQNEEKNTN